METTINNGRQPMCLEGGKVSPQVKLDRRRLQQNNNNNKRIAGYESPYTFLLSFAQSDDEVRLISLVLFLFGNTYCCFSSAQLSSPRPLNYRETQICADQSQQVADAAVFFSFSP